MAPGKMMEDGITLHANWLLGLIHTSNQYIIHEY